ncbi:MAG: hypothetical protein PF904_04905 [Kiritimatiellae bacterium]|nr:hypothetical protein [Kiritimatiellia bacterium]
MKSQQFEWCASLAAMAVMILAAGHVEAQAVDTVFQVSSGSWTNANHWNERVPTSIDDAFVGSSLSGGETPATCILDTAGQACDRLVVGHYAGNSGQLDITGGDLTLTGAGGAPQAAIADRGTGIVNLSGGTWNNGGKNLHVGDDDTAYGELNISNDGAITNLNYVYVGNYGTGVINIGGNAELRQFGRAYVGFRAGSTGIVNQTGGLWDMGGTSAAYFTVGQSGYGEYHISGGVLTNCYKLYNAGSSTGLLSIVGSTASIHVEEFRSATANSTLRITPDSGGISPVNVFAGSLGLGKIYLGGTLEVDFSNYDSTDDLTIIKHDGALSGTFATNTVTAGWSADVTYASGEVRLTNITAPLKGTVVLIY